MVKKIGKKTLVKSKGMNQSVIAAFVGQALLTPTIIAVSDQNNSLTYHELLVRVQHFADYIKSQNLSDNVLVAICLDRSIDWVVAALSVMMAGLAYLPIEPTLPIARIEYMLKDSRTKLIITQDDLIKQLELAVYQINLISINLSLAGPLGDYHVIKKPLKLPKAGDLNYVIYTSGSTGLPKGVMVSYGALINFLNSMKHIFDVKQNETLLAVTTFSFDIAALELYLPLITGGEVIICSADITVDGYKLREKITKCKPTRIQATPATWQMLFSTGWENNEGVEAICGGEVLTEKLKLSFLKCFSKAWNMYGPTETTVWSLYHRISGDSFASVIGKPIDNTEVLIIDENEHELLENETGEICIAGKGLALGYLNKPELTRERFINYFAGEYKKIYKTGDLGCRLHNGDIKFLGRKDTQIKLRGYRIELGEIEHKLGIHPAINSCIVTVRGEDINKQLIAYYTTDEYNQSRKELCTQELQAYLANYLPQYMIPTQFIPIKAFPLTPNKKIDRNALAEEKVFIKADSNKASKLSKKICIIGAGPAGLVMAKSLIEEGHQPVIYEKQHQIGGIWNLYKSKKFGVYARTRFQNSKDTSFFSDFPPADEMSIFPSVQEVRNYLGNYCAQYQLQDYVSFESEVISVQQVKENKWKIAVKSGKKTSASIFDGVALCHGRYSVPAIPNIKNINKFEGMTIHAAEYFDNSIFSDKRVLIIGNGVSGMDIAEDAVQVAKEVYWCMRSKKLVLPRMVGFLPNDYISPANLLITAGTGYQLDRLKQAYPEYYELYKKSGLFPTLQEFKAYPFIHINDGIIKHVVDQNIHIIDGELLEVTSHGGIFSSSPKKLYPFDVIVFCTGYRNEMNFSYVKDISVYSDFAMGLFYAKAPTLVNTYGLNDVGTTGTLPYLEMVSRWYAQIISLKYRLNEEELAHRVIKSDIIVAPLASVIIGLKLKLLPDPTQEFKEFWRLISYPSFSVIYRLRGPGANPDAVKWLEKNASGAIIADDQHDAMLRECKLRLLASFSNIQLENLLLNGEITKEEFDQSQKHISNPIYLNWDTQYIPCIRPVSLSNKKTLNYGSFKALLIAIFANIMNIKEVEIDVDIGFGRYGLNSVTLTMFASEILKAYPTIKLTPEIFLEHFTIESLAKFLYENYINKSEVQDLIEASSQEIASPTEKIPDGKIYNDSNSDVAIIGVAAKLPLANNLVEFWQKLLNDDKFIDKIPENRWSWQEYYGRVDELNKTDSNYGAFINDIEYFDAKHFDITAEEAPFMDPQHRLLLETVWELIENAGYSVNALKGSNLGVYIGVERQDYLNKIKAGNYPIAGYMNTCNSHSMLVNRISHYFDWCGPNLATNAACSSSFVAIDNAITALHAGKAHMALAGGVHLLLSPDIVICNRKLGLFTSEEKVRPFDVNANGHFFSEGVGLILLKKLNNAIKDKDNILAIIKGISVHHGGQAAFMAAPQFTSQVDAIVSSLSQAGLDSSEIDCIEAQGAANILSDSIELKVYHTIFNSYRDKKLPICCIKGHTGHFAGASGVISLIKALFSINNNQLIKINNLSRLNWGDDEEEFACRMVDKNESWLPKYVAGKQAPRRVGVHNFGFGGVVGHLVLEESCKNNNSDLVQSEQVQLIVFSAQDQSLLQESIRQFYNYLEEKSYQYFGITTLSLHDIAYTLQIGRVPMKYRAAFCVASIYELKKHISAYLDGNSIFATEGYVGEKISSKLLNCLEDQEFQALMKQWFYRNEVKKLAELWVHGININWQDFYQDSPLPNRVPLPTTLFKKQYFWLDTKNFQKEDIIRDQDAKNMATNPIEKTNGYSNNPVHFNLISDICYTKDRNQNLTIFIKYLSNIISDLLDISIIQEHIHINLLSLGIDSISWSTLCSIIQTELGYIISPALLLSEDISINSICAKLVDHMDNNIKNNSPHVKVNNIISDPNNRYKSFMLTDIQESFLVGKHKNSVMKTIGAQIYLEFELKELSLGRLQASWEKLIYYHDMLRVVFQDDGTQIVKQFVPEYKIRLENLTHLSTNEKNKQLAIIRDGIAYNIFDEAIWPQFLLQVTQLEDNKYIIHFSINEIIADAESIMLLISQWHQLYYFQVEDVGNLPTLNLFFRDYVFYKSNNILAGKNNELTARYINSYINLPSGPNIFKDLSTLTFASKRSRHTRTINSTDWRSLRKLAEENHVTVTTLLLTIFELSVRKFSNDEYFTIILTSSGRNILHPDIHNIVGPFLSTSFFISNTLSDININKRMQDNQKQLLEILNYPQISSIHILRELKSQHKFKDEPLFPVVFTSLLPSQNKLKLDCQWLESFCNSNSLILTPQVFFEHQCLEKGNELVLLFDITEDAILKSTANGIIESYVNGLKELANNNHPYIDILNSKIDLMPLKDKIIPKGMVKKLTPIIEGLKLQKLEDNLYEKFPLSDMQNAYLFNRYLKGENLVSGQIYYQIQLPRIDIERLKKALAMVINHHEMLRAVIYSDGTQAIQQVTPNLDICVNDYAHMDQGFAYAFQTSERKRLVEKVFAPDSWPYFEISITHMPNEQSILQASFDFMVLDSHSVNLFFKDLFNLYNNLHTELKSSGFTFRDYIIALMAHQQSDSFLKAMGYWQEKFADIASGPNLPYLVKPEDTYSLPRSRRVVSVEYYQDLLTFVDKQSLSLSAVLLTAFCEALAREVINHEDFTIVIVNWDRPQGYPELTSIVGDFCCLSWIEYGSKSKISFMEKIRLVEQQWQDDLQYGGLYGLKELRKRAQTENKKPLFFPIVFTNFDPSFDFKLSSVNGFVKSLSQTMSVYLDLIIEENDGQLLLNFDYIEAVFPNDLRNRIINSCLDILGSL